MFDPFGELAEVEFGGQDVLPAVVLEEEGEFDEVAFPAEGAEAGFDALCGGWRGFGCGCAEAAGEGGGGVGIGVLVRCAGFDAVRVGLDALVYFVDEGAGSGSFATLAARKGGWAGWFFDRGEMRIIN